MIKVKKIIILMVIIIVIIIIIETFVKVPRLPIALTVHITAFDVCVCLGVCLLKFVCMWVFVLMDVYQCITPSNHSYTRLPHPSLTSNPHFYQH